MKIVKPRASLLTRQSQWQRFFSIRVIDLWNGHPQNVVDAKTVPQFKARLDQHWNSLAYGYQQRPMASNNPLTCKCKCESVRIAIGVKFEPFLNWTHLKIITGYRITDVTTLVGYTPIIGHCECKGLTKLIAL